MIKLVVALGNPGPQYELTRHNIGWLALDQLPFYDRLNWQSKFKGVYASYSIQGEKVYFLKPQTYMNLSGESVQPCAHFFKIAPQEILVIHDELDLPFGKVMVKRGGGLAGHNGLKSIAEKLGTNDFYRLRLGIDKPPGGNVSSWVLSAFNAEESEKLGLYLAESAKVIEFALKNGIEKAQRSYNKKSLID